MMVKKMLVSEMSERTRVGLVLISSVLTSVTLYLLDKREKFILPQIFSVKQGSAASGPRANSGPPDEVLKSPLGVYGGTAVTKQSA